MDSPSFIYIPRSLACLFSCFLTAICIFLAEGMASAALPPPREEEEEEEEEEDLPLPPLRDSRFSRSSIPLSSSPLTTEMPSGRAIAGFHLRTGVTAEPGAPEAPLADARC